MPELIEAAKNPPDLKKLLSPARVKEYRKEAVGLHLCYATERVDESILNLLYAKAEKADVISKMKAMQSGEKVNTGEGRSALHTAMRDIFDEGKRPAAAQEAIHLAKIEIEKLKFFLTELEEFTDIIQIGIGGSSLGPEAIYLALAAYSLKGRKAHFISNVDPDEATKIIRSVDLSKSLFIAVSKSGSTLETVTNETFVREELKKAGLDPKNHFIAVTGKGSPMDNPDRYRASFYIWDYIGGRYSVTSMVGAVLLGFVLGMENLLEFLRGAHAMDLIALADRKQNLPLLGALLGIWNRNYLNHPTVAVIPYSQALARFPAHLQQLDMESNGKRVNKQGKPVIEMTGPIVWGEPGTNGQHSFFQLIHQGTTVVPLEIIGFKQNQYHNDLTIQGSYSQEKLLSNLFAQAIALAQGQDNANANKVFPGNRPSHILLGNRLDPFTMGALLAYYEHKVVFQGFIWNINSFDQEGVQLGKKLATQMIDVFIAQRDQKKSAYELGQAFLDI